MPISIFMAMMVISNSLLHECNWIKRELFIIAASLFCGYKKTRHNFGLHLHHTDMCKCVVWWAQKAAIIYFWHPGRDCSSFPLLYTRPWRPLGWTLRKSTRTMLFTQVQCKVRPDNYLHRSWHLFLWLKGTW